MKKILLIIIVTVLYFLAMKQFTALYNADVDNTTAQSLLSSGDYSNALIEATKAIEQNPQEPLYYRGRAKVWIAQLTLVGDEQKLRE